MLAVVGRYSAQAGHNYVANGMAGRSWGWHVVTGTLLISPPVLKFGGWFVTLDLGQIWDFRL